MNKASAPSAPLPEFEGNEFQSHPPPPSYDQAMAVYPQPVAGAHQGGYAPYPTQQLPYPPAPAQMSYPPAATQLPYPPASGGQMPMPYPPAGPQVPYPQAGQQMLYLPSGGTQTQSPIPQRPPEMPTQECDFIPSDPNSITQLNLPPPQPRDFLPSNPNSITQRNVPPPQPPGPQPAPVNTAVFVSGPVAVGPKPCRLRCPMCHSDIKTSTVTENQSGAHIACIILCLLGCFLCSCIPYCMDSCKIVQHKCPVCKSYLGTYKG